jgi:glycosyltransferase involved in cell wall biosynthesis/predicted SAM-dependent methyltransferase
MSLRQLKLEIGSGSNPQPGYIHLDCRRGLPSLDIVGDIKRFLPLREGSIDEVLSHSSIEHVSWRRIRETLADWYRVLRPGGRAIIYTPDFQYLCRMYLEGKTDPHIDKSYIEEANSVFGAYTPAAWAMIKMFAGQEYDENYHYASYDFDLLKSVLEAAGFCQVTRIPPEYSLRVTAMKPVSEKISRPEKKTVQDGANERSVLPQTAPRVPVAAHAHHPSKLVHVNLVDRGWILERMGIELERHLDYVSVGDAPDPNATINYHINYHAFKRKGACDMAFFTHIEESVPAVRELFFATARTVDHCVCMSKKYEEILRANGVDRVTTIMPGVDLETFRPAIRIGVVGRTYHTGRKGEELVAKAMSIPFTQWYFCGDGWPSGGVVFTHERLAEFYQVIDVLLVPALYEGGPMPVLEALASGKPVLSPPVGFVPEFPHIEYEAGNFEQLRNRIEALVQERRELRRSVEQRTWLRWAMEHHRIFSGLLPANGPISIKMPEQNPLPKTVPKINALSSTIRPSIEKGVPATPDKKLRILLVARKEQLAGGPSIRIPVLQKQLAALGHSADICYDPAPDTTGYDVAHVFNVWAPWEALPQMRHLKQTGVPLVLSPIFLDLAESAWAAKAVMLIFTQTTDPAQREHYLDALANGSLMLDNKSRSQGLEVFPGGNAMVREIIMLADHIIALSVEEMQRIAKCLRIARRPFTLVRNAADYAVFETASADWFVKNFGVKDFVLCVGRIERRKNQALLLQALRESALPIVLVGQNGEADYEQVCRSLAPQGTLFIPQLGRAELASAYAAARVCAQTSWAEGASLVNLEAAAACCPLVVSNRASEFEYFGDVARYCDPADRASILDAVREAYGSFEKEKQMRVALRERLKETCTWENATVATVKAYERAMDGTSKQM